MACFIHESCNPVHIGDYTTDVDSRNKPNVKVPLLIVKDGWTIWRALLAYVIIGISPRINIIRYLSSTLMIWPIFPTLLN